MESILEQRRRRYCEVGPGRLYQERIRTAGGFHRLSHRLELAAVRRALERIDGSSALDAPCGTGPIHPILKRKFSTLFSADVSPEMLEEFRREHGTGTYRADLFDLPFPEESFDWVACHRFFHHLEEDGQRLRLLRSLARVCRQGVILYVWLKTPFRRRPASQRHSIEEADLEELLRDAGLQATSYHHVAWPFVPKTIVVCRKRGAAPRK